MCMTLTWDVSDKIKSFIKADVSSSAQFRGETSQQREIKRQNK